jgi:hypothetical protein
VRRSTASRYEAKTKVDLNRYEACSFDVLRDSLGAPLDHTAMKSGES